jgi:hypothetical protein
LRPGAKFCPKCGQPVQAAGAPAAGKPPASPAAEKAGDAYPPPAYDSAPPEDSAPTSLVRKPLFWVALAGLAGCLVCALVGFFIVREAGDLFGFGDEVETISSLVPGLEEIATQIPEIEEIATQIPEIETLATDIPEIEELATSLPGLEDLATDLPLPDLEIELPAE